jgi:hypothetical protein
MSDKPVTRKCAHEGCTCEIREGQTYCGPYCATAAAETDVHHEQGRCECGHDACRAVVAPGEFS